MHGNDNRDDFLTLNPRSGVDSIELSIDGDIHDEGDVIIEMSLKLLPNYAEEKGSIVSYMTEGVAGGSPVSDKFYEVKDSDDEEFFSLNPPYSIRVSVTEDEQPVWDTLRIMPDSLFVELTLDEAKSLITLLQRFVERGQSPDWQQ